MGNLAGASIWSPAANQQAAQGGGGGGGGGGPATAKSGYFVAVAESNKVIRVGLDGSTSTFYTYAAQHEPYGIAIDSQNSRLFVLCGDGTTAKFIDRFDTITGLTGTPTATTTGYGGGTVWGGNAFYNYDNSSVYWFVYSGSNGMHKMNAAFTAYSQPVSGTAIMDGDWWPEERVVYTIEQTSTDQLYTGPISGPLTNKGNLQGFTKGIVVPPAHLTGSSSFIFYSERQTGRIRRTPRTTTTGDTAWCLLEVASSSLGLLPGALEIDYISNYLIFLGWTNGGNSSTGLYRIPLQKAAVTDGQVELIANLQGMITGGSNSASGQGIAILYDGSPTSLMTDTAP